MCKILGSVSLRDIVVHYSIHFELYPLSSLSK